MVDFFEERFRVKKIKNKEKLVNEMHIQSENYSIEVDYHNELFTPEFNEDIDLIFYLRSNDESMVAEKFSYLMQGIFYNIEQKEEYVYEVSFGGLLMKIKSHNILFDGINNGDILMVGFAK